MNDRIAELELRVAELTAALKDVLFWAKEGREYYEETTGNKTYCSKDVQDSDMSRAEHILSASATKEGD